MNNDAANPKELYLDLLKKCLTRYVFGETFHKLSPRKGSLKSMLYAPARKLLALGQLELVRHVPTDLEKRAEGVDWPLGAETMIGLRRLDNLQDCIRDVLQRGVPGDLIEAGVWRGGATIFMRAALKAYGDCGRIVWVADSFRGLPKPDPHRYPADAGDSHWRYPLLAVPLEEVKANFARYDLLDDRVRFLVGLFHETLLSAPIERLSILRIDADMYGSTMDALRYLYPKLSVGGYVIIDDYGAIPVCRAAVEDFRSERRITEKLEHIDWTGVFWNRLH